MKQISKVFLACACSLSGLTTQAQDQTVWSNDFSNASTEYFIRAALMPFSAILSGKIIPCPSRHVPRKTPNRYRYGQASVHITALTVMW